MIKYFLPLLLLITSCKQESRSETADTAEAPEVAYYKEPYRPQFHFSPEENWMNDPNGLVYYNGVYHLFYQYYPEDVVWGPMHWGHAESKDMLHWEHQPIALYPDELGYIFSGSAVVDHQNSSGLGSEENPPMVAFFTYHDPEKEKQGRSDYQTQGMAYSLDNGRSWEKYAENPIIPNNEFRDFRDPKVFWDEARKQWVMLLVAGDHLRIYRSDDLIEWTFMSSFGKEVGAHGGVWECPDLFPLTAEGTEEEKWVLLISINPGGPNGGSATQYFTGEFDGTTFSTKQEDIKWLDMGADNYAGVTYNDTPDGSRLFIGWMGNWNYAQKTPTSPWRSAMTLPRDLTLVKNDSGYTLRNYPVQQLESLRQPLKVVEAEDGSSWETANFNASEIIFNTQFGDTEFRFSNAEGEELRIMINAEEKQMVVDRSKSGLTEFDPSFAAQPHTASLATLGEAFEVRMILDAGSIEIFLDKGEVVMTEIVFPKTPYTRFEIIKEGEQQTPEFYSLNPVW